MKIRIGDIFRVSHGDSFGAPESYVALTRGAHSTPADIQKGIWAYKAVRDNSHDPRIPAVILHSNPLKEGTQGTPWIDIVEPDVGYAIYNGDNRKADSTALTPRGNDLMIRIKPIYASATSRRLAPPVLLFTQREVHGNRKGYREFSGYGVPAAYSLVTQRGQHSAKHFTNLVIEVVLFKLAEENDLFDWSWIDRRRDAQVSTAACLDAAPRAWRDWVRDGETVLERCRRHVGRRQVETAAQQEVMSELDKSVLENVTHFFTKQKHAFEGLAALIASRVIGQGCKRGWVTRRSGDGGIDFVCRLDIGTEFSRVPIVVLGQAKCQRLVSGKDLARVVARLQRGWIGVFVTTGTFSTAAQRELRTDKYPVMLINGRRLARELRLMMVDEGISLSELLKGETAWYENNTHPLEPERVLSDAVHGTSIS